MLAYTAHVYSHTTHAYRDIYIYIYALRGPPPPPVNGLGSRPFCGVGCGGVDWESPWWVKIPLPFFSPCGVGPVGGNPPPSSPPVVWGWVGIPLPPPVVWGLGVEFVLGSLGEVQSVVLPEWGLLVLVQLLWCTKPSSVGEDFVLRLWDVRGGVSADLGDSC